MEDGKPDGHQSLIGGAIAGVIAGIALGLSRHVLPIVFPHMQASLGLSSGKMGVLATCYFLAYMFCSYFWGHRSDRIGPKPVISFCLVICGVSLFMVGVSSSFLFLVLFSVLIGVGAGGLYVPAISSLIKIFSLQKRGKAISIFFLGEGLLAITLGLAVPLVVLALSWRWVWWIAGLFSILFSVAIRLLIQNLDQTKDSVIGDKRESFGGFGDFGFIKIPNIIFLSAVYFFHAMARGAFITFIVAYLVEKGITYRSAGGAFSLMGLGFIPGSFIAGYLIDRFRSYVLVGLVVAELSAIATVFVFGNLLSTYVAVVIIGCCLTGIPTAVSVITAENCSKTSYGQVLGWLTFCMGFGTMVSPSLAGYLAEATKTLATTQLFAVCALLIAVFLSFLMERGLIKMRATGR